jgi:hypothetical protein
MPEGVVLPVGLFLFELIPFKRSGSIVILGQLSYGCPKITLAKGHG